MSRVIACRMSSVREGRFQIHELTLELRGLSRAFDGYRIVQLGDLHFGPLTPVSHVSQAVALANAFEPDLIVLTGDYIQLSATGLRSFFATRVNPKAAGWLNYRRRVRKASRELSHMLSALRARDGIIAILGNHDYLEGMLTIRRQFPAHFVWLVNDARWIIREQGVLEIAGVDDCSRGRPDLSQALRVGKPLSDLTSTLPNPSFTNLRTPVPGSTPPGGRILLSHNPDIVLDSQAGLLRDVDLILCGHTHGGQLRFPYLKPFVTRTRQREHVAGLSYFGQTPIYVTAGVGYSLVRARLFCPPEVTVIELRRPPCG